MGLHDRVELQSEVRAPRELVFGLLSTAEGLARWLDSADLEPRVGGAIRIQMRDAVATGTVRSLQPPQHISWSFDWEDAPLTDPSVVAFDAIPHGARTHLTLRHVGLRDPNQRDIHAALWRYWFDRLCAAADSIGQEATRVR